MTRLGSNILVLGALASCTLQLCVACLPLTHTGKGKKVVHSLEGAMLGNGCLKGHALQGTLAHQLKSPLTHTCTTNSKVKRIEILVTTMMILVVVITFPAYARCRQ